MCACVCGGHGTEYNSFTYDNFDACEYGPRTEVVQEKKKNEMNTLRSMCVRAIELFGSMSVWMSANEQNLRC